MKRFKKFLLEADTANIAQGAGEPTVQSLPPQFLPDYWQTPSIHPNTPPTQQEKPENPNPPPDPIDWDRIRELFDSYQGLLDQIRLWLSIGNYDAIIQALQDMGITVPPGISNLQDWLQQYYERLMEEEFNRLYPNATPQQYRTFQEHSWEFLRRFLRPGNKPGPGGINSPQYRPIDISDPSTWPNPGFDPNVPFDWPEVPRRSPAPWDIPNPYIPYDDRYNFSPNIG